MANKRPDDRQEAINLILYSTKDPETPDAFSQTGHPPALTTLLFRVCDNDPKKFEEATRLIELFILKALEMSDGR